MLKHEQTSQENPQSAAQTHVTARALTEALASLDAKKARQDFEQVGTVTLAEGIEQCSIEAAPEELLIEIDKIRESEAQKEKSRRCRKALRIALIAELLSAALCLLAVLGMHQTIFNPSWQQARQAAEFQNKLQLSLKPNPRYSIYVRRQGSPTTVPGIYPLYCLPDGCNLHISDSVNDEGHYEGSPFMPQETPYVEFRDTAASYTSGDLFVYYDGLLYRRAWIRKQDVTRLIQGHDFSLYRDIGIDPQDNITDFIPLTVSTRSIQAAQEQWLDASPSGDGVIQIAEGRHLQLDEHAWEQYALPSR